MDVQAGTLPMQGPSPAGLFWWYVAINSLARELPDDFLDPASPDIDETRRERLLKGAAATRKMAHWRAIMWTGLISAVLFLLPMLLLRALLPGLELWPLVLWVSLWAIAVFGLVASGCVYLLHRTEVRDLLAFVRAYKGSSLGRDLV